MAAVVIERKGTQARYWYGKTWNRPSIHSLYFHINNNALSLPPKILHNHILFPIIFILGITVVPREIGDEGYAKFWGVNKVNYGLCENGELKKNSRPEKNAYSYFEKGCREKCTRQSRKVLWVVLSLLFFKGIWKNDTIGHGQMFASAKGKQQKYVRQLQCQEQHIDHIPYYLSGLSRAHIFRQDFSK